MNEIDQLIARWKSHGIICPPGATEPDLFDFERRHNVIIPPDLRAYFAAVNGTGSRYEFEEDFFAFWPLKEVISVAEEYSDRCQSFADAPNYFIFADHSISLPTIAIRLLPTLELGNPVATFFTDSGAFEHEIQFGSFTDFLIHYLHDPIDAAVLPRTPAPTEWPPRKWWQFWR